MSEWQQSIKHQLEVLHTEGDTDDGAAEYHTERKVCEGNLNTSEDNPQHIHNDREAASRIILRFNISTKGPQGEHSESHNLHTEGNTNNREAEHKSTEEVSKR
jgi:hypothetical protein